ncbi:nucleosome assembly protein 1;1-like [Camellia sinensis]|uniref:nucleosome assembly protein 1;1-like n=1 Tax=Camellia sinensis TaxID=4442 RepID=UPI001036CCBF|nr:nucleosome assembly protein 1;1-like [Camellia sinensis]
MNLFRDDKHGSFLERKRKKTKDAESGEMKNKATKRELEFSTIWDKIIPYVALWFLREAIQGHDFEDVDNDNDDDDNDEEENEDKDEDNYENTDEEEDKDKTSTKKQSSGPKKGIRALPKEG